MEKFYRQTPKVKKLILSHVDVGSKIVKGS